MIEAISSCCKFKINSNRIARFLKLSACFSFGGISMFNASQAYAQDSVNGFLRGTSTSKPYFAVFDVRPATVSTEAIQQAVADAFRVHYNNIEVSQQMPPSPLPKGAPRMSFVQKNTSVGSVSEPVCNGTSSVVNSADTSMLKYGEFSLLQACIFPYKDGHRVNVYAVFAQKSGASSVAILGSSLGRMFTKAVGLGDTSKFIGETIDDVEKRLKDLTPTAALVELQPSREGKVMVADPAPAHEASTAVSQAAPAQGYAAIPGVLPEVAMQLRAAMAMAVKQRNEMGNANAPQPAPQVNPAIQARKELSAMGLTYYNQDQFIEAVQREDKVACELFLQAGAISVTKPNKDKHTPLQIAKNPEILEMLKSYHPN